MCNNEHESKKRYPLVPVDFVMFLLRLKEIRRLSVKMADVSGSFLRI